MYQASFKQHALGEYQVLDHNGYDTIGEYVGYREAKSIVKRYNAIIFNYGSAVINEAVRRANTPTFDRMREEQLTSFSNIMIQQRNISDMEYSLENRDYLAKDVEENLEEEEYL